MPTKAWIRGVGNSNLDNEENVSWVKIGWATDSVGFGEFTLRYNHVTNEWTAATETMPKDFVRGILSKIVDDYTVSD